MSWSRVSWVAGGGAAGGASRCAARAECCGVELGALRVDEEVVAVIPCCFLKQAASAW